MGRNKFSKSCLAILIIFLIILSFPGKTPLSATGFYSLASSPVDSMGINSDMDSFSPVSTVPSFMLELLAESLGHLDEIKTSMLGQFYPPPKEMFLGTPILSNLLPDYLQMITDPYYWSNYFYEALVNGIFIIPKPVDVVKPELILPTEEVKKGTEISALPRQQIDLSEVTYNWQGREKTVKDYMTTTQTDSLVFIHEGNLIYEDYANGWSPEMRAQPWSVTKSFTSALVGIARDEGKIDSVQDPIERYIPELEGTDWEGTTIKNLLQMESGLYWDEEHPLLAFNSQVQQWKGMFLDFLTGGRLGMTRNEYLKSMNRIASPGEQFLYNSGDTQVLAWLVETVYESSYAEVLSAKIWKPLGMEGNAEIIIDRKGDAIASQSLYALAYDLARFGELYRNNGQAPSGKQIISAEWVEESVTFTDNSEGVYGYQWWTHEEEWDDSFEASGFQGNKITVDPQKEVTGVRLSHHLGANLRPDGDNPFDLSTYGFEVEMGSAEWNAMYNAVAEKLNSNSLTGTEQNNH